MEKSQLIELICTLSQEEKLNVRQFASLDFVNNGRMHAQVLPLLDLCLNHPWDRGDLTLEKRKVFELLFPGQNFVEGKLDKVMVEAHKIVKYFLQTQYYFRESNEFFQLLDFAEITRLRGLNNRHVQLIDKLKRLQEDHPYKNFQYYRRQFTLDGAIHYSECLNNRGRGDLNIRVVVV